MTPTRFRGRRSPGAPAPTIDITAEGAIAYWTARWRVSREVLVRAVEAVGPDADAVARHLELPSDTAV